MQYIRTLLEKLVSFNTVNDPQANLRPTDECANFISSFLDKECGIKSEILVDDGFYNVFGQIGSGSPHILLLAHFDTVPVRLDQWNTNPFELIVQGDEAYGRGALDNKSGVTILLMVAKALSESLNGIGTVSFAFTGDEEIGGQGTNTIRELLIQQNQLPDFIINCDAHGERIVTRRRNGFSISLNIPRKKTILKGQKVQMRFETRIEGREMRHSAYFLPGIDQHALLKASKFLFDHRGWKILSIKEHAFVKLNVVPDYIVLELIAPSQEGDKWAVEDGLTTAFRSLLLFSRINFPTEPSDFGINSLPNLLHLDNEKIEVYFDVRAMISDSSTVQSAFELLAAEKFDEFTLRIVGGRGFLNTSKNEFIVQLASQLAKNYSINPNPFELEGASDSRYFSQDKIPIIEIGPLGGNLHGISEYVQLSSLKRVVSFVRALVENLLS
ncbi:MAG: M20/M25/M40 family metallo-hydrolase [Candidatus Hermodarchaeota archaeon]